MEETRRLGEYSDPEVTPEPHDSARERAKQYVKYTLYLELPPGIDHLDLVLPALPEDRPVVDDDEVYGLQRHGDLTRRGIGGHGDPTAATALTADKRKAAEAPLRHIPHAQVLTMVDKLNAYDRKLIWNLGNLSVKASALTLNCTRTTVYNHTMKALDALVELLYKENHRRGC